MKIRAKGSIQGGHIGKGNHLRSSLGSQVRFCFRFLMSTLMVWAVVALARWYYNSWDKLSLGLAPHWPPLPSPSVRSPGGISNIFGTIVSVV